jgi:hypothetical protein
MLSQYRGPFPGVKQPGSDVEYSPPSAQRLGISGALPLLHLYAFRVWTGKSLPVFIYMILTGRREKIIISSCSVYYPFITQIKQLVLF